MPSAPADGLRPLATGTGDEVEIVDELGRGSRAAVYRIRRGGAEYALKVLPRPATAGDRALLEFRREAALLARLDNPGTPRVYDVGQRQGHPYLVMELLDGRPLSQLLERGPLDLGQLLRLAVEVADVLADAHAIGLVHRDVKPANIVVGPDGAAHLIDFGLAGRRQDSYQDNDVAVGTFDYCAPEQTGALRRPVDGRADLYSLGVVLYECATGRTPFSSDDVGELIRRHATVAPPDPRELRPELPPGLVTVIGRLLAKDPDDRYRSAGDLLRALEALGAPAHADRVVRRGRASAPRNGGLVGRDRERADLLDRWRQARAGAGGIVLVEGPTGIGKSRLVQELATAAARDGAVVLTGRCDPDGPVPLSPLRAAVDGYVRSLVDLPPEERAAPVDALRTAAGPGAGLLRPLSPTLGTILDAPALHDADRSRQFTAAVAGFLTQLARPGGGVLLLEDVQWADPATLGVLHRVAAELTGTPLLVVATVRRGAGYGPAVARFRADAGQSLDLRIALGPLDRPAIARLVSAQLAGCTVGDDLIDQLTVRGAGNPLATLEFLHALIDAGALRPAWGVWRLDADRLPAVALRADVLELLAARVGGLDTRQREVLTVAAAVGSRFRPELVAQAAGVEPAAVLAAVGDATGLRLVDTAGDGRYDFVHDRIREALLRDLDDAERRRVHQRIAEALDAPAGQAMAGTDQVYAVAAHYAAGELARRPDRVFATGVAAGHLALAENAAAAAVPFLETAAAAARISGTGVDSRFRETLARAYLRSGRLDAAQRELREALESEADPLRRAALLLCLALAQRGNWECEAAIASCREGLALIGRPVPTGAARLVAAALASSLRALLTAKLGRGRTDAGTPADQRERIRLHAALNTTAAHSSGVGLINPLFPYFSLQAAWPALRLGPSPEYVEALSGLGIALNLPPTRRWARRAVDRARTVASEVLGDPKLVAGAATVASMVEGVTRITDLDQSDAYYRVAEEQRRWLDTGVYLNVTLMRCNTLLDRGYAKEALQWYEHGMTAVAAAELPAGLVHGHVVVMARALLGDARGATGLLEELRRHGPRDPGRLVSIGLAAIRCAYELSELDEPFERAIAEFTALRVPTLSLHLPQRAFFVYQAYGRLALCRRVAEQAPEELPARVAAAERAVRRLRRAALGGLLRAHAVLASASLLQVRGAHPKALALLDRVSATTGWTDAPVIDYELARLRARGLQALGRAAPALRQAQTALALATEHGWAYRARWIRSEFGVDVSPRTSARSPLETGAAVGVRQRRRMEALQQVTRAAASVLDPQQLARVALDEALRILDAERALLFLTDAGATGDAPLRLAVARDAARRDLDDATGFGSTLVERVAASRETLVVTGSDEGAALGSRSAVVYGLRSILIAPLELDGRLLGVVYLDSRVAKGIFTEEDVNILSAITHPIAASLETARAAKLDAAVQAARQQRDLAETLRATMARLSATLDPDEVKHRLLAIVTADGSTDRACLVLREGDGLVVTASDPGLPCASAPRRGAAGAFGDGVLGDGAFGDGAFDVGAFDVGAVLDRPGVTAGRADSPAWDRRAAVALLGPVRCWLTVPVKTRSHLPGALVAGSTVRESFTDAEIEIVAAIAEQGAAAYDNAQLFRQVERLATTDSLTGVHNRRHFSELAVDLLGAAERDGRRVAALMIDIDHFKRINDTYGHGTGDEVIRTVATVIAGNIRGADILGRLGGEEFAVILPEPSGDPAGTAERLRVAVSAGRYGALDDATRVTVSIGVTRFRPGDTLATLLARADDALYRAKQGGRDRVDVA